MDGGSTVSCWKKCCTTSLVRLIKSVWLMTGWLSFANTGIRCLSLISSNVVGIVFASRNGFDVDSWLIPITASKGSFHSTLSLSFSRDKRTCNVLQLLPANSTYQHA